MRGNMKRKLFVAITLISVTLCAISGWWWIRSSGRVGQFTVQHSGGGSVSLLASSGKLLVTKTSDADKSGDAVSGGQVSWKSAPHTPGAASGEPLIQETSFSYKHGERDSTLVLPMWLITGFCAVAPFMWIKGKVAPAKKPNKH